MSDNNRNLSPQEEAQELVESFINFASNEATTENGFLYSDEIELWNAKQCALIAVDKLIKAFEFQRFEFGDDYNTTYSHYIKVKQAIEKYE